MGIIIPTESPREVSAVYRPFEAFRPAGRFLSVVGSGGKTSFLRFWSARLPGTVILTTSTRIFPFPGIPLVEAGPDLQSCSRVLRDLRAALSRSPVVCLGRPEPSGKLASPDAAVPFEVLLSVADFVLLEADGSAGRPLKAHRPWEPVVPSCSDVTVGVVGASGLGRPAREACHCPELFASLAGISPEDPVRPEHVASVLNRENLASCWLVNQADTLPDPAEARRLCDLITVEAFPCSLSPR